MWYLIVVFICISLTTTSIFNLKPDIQFNYWKTFKCLELKCVNLLHHLQILWNLNIDEMFCDGIRSEAEFSFCVSSALSNIF